MITQDIINLYEKYKKIHKNDTYKHVSEILIEAKEIHHKDFKKSPTKKNDHEQSWKGFKGHALEKLLDHILKDEVFSLGLKIVAGNKFERTKPENLSIELQNIKKNLSIDFVIYNPKNFKVVAVLSSKTTLRERIAQSGYWNIKIKNYDLTKHIRMYFITPDEDGNFSEGRGVGKSRAIVETDLDGAYIMTEQSVKESENVKTFDKFIDDLKKLIK